MKKAMILMTLLVLTLCMMAGCGCRNSKPATTTPTTMPAVTTAPTTEAATMPTTMATEPTTEATIPDGNGPLSTDSTTATDNTNARTMPGISDDGITGSIR